MIRRLLIAALLAGAAPAFAMPDFIPKPAEAYEGYVALEMPRADVPVGALWVQNFGPSGEGASPDNLVTERSLSQVTISSDLQLGLTVGILKFFGLDPSYRNRLSARFGDLSIVRVKDMAKLSGPSSEPRIYEAVRAGTITITTDNDIGLKLETRAAGQNLPVVGRSDNGSRRSFSMDGRDMFIAFRVASQEEVRGALDEVRLRMGDGGWAGTINGRDFVIQSEGLCAEGGSAERATLPISTPAEAVSGGVPPNSRDLTLPAVIARPEQAERPASSEGRSPSFPLRVPVSDGKGGLLVEAVVQTSEKKSRAGNDAPTLCTSSAAASIKATVQLVGRRLQAFRNPKAPRW